MTFEEAAKYFGEVKPDDEYTEEEIEEIRKEQIRIVERRGIKRNMPNCKTF